MSQVKCYLKIRFWITFLDTVRNGLMKKKEDFPKVSQVEVGKRNFWSRYITSTAITFSPSINKDDLFHIDNENMKLITVLTTCLIGAFLGFNCNEVDFDF